MMELSVYYMHRDANPEGYKPQLTDKGKAKYEEFTQGNLEDALTKVIKLIANLSTDEIAAQRDLITISKTQLLDDFFHSLKIAIEARQLSQNEEFILNAISCSTNVLFYDTQSNTLLSDAARKDLFHTCKPFLLAT